MMILLTFIGSQAEKEEMNSFTGTGSYWWAHCFVLDFRWQLCVHSRIKMLFWPSFLKDVNQVLVHCRKRGNELLYWHWQLLVGTLFSVNV